MYYKNHLNVINHSQIKTFRFVFSFRIFNMVLQHLLPNFMVGGIFLLDIHLTSISYIACIIGKCSLNKVLRLPHNLGLESLLKPMLHANNKSATTLNHHLKMVPKNISRTSSIMWSKQVQKTYAIFNRRKRAWWKIYRGIKQQK